MSNHYILEKYGDEDVCEFKQGGMYKIGKIRESLKTIITNRLHNAIKQPLQEQEIKIPEKFYDEGKEVYQYWFTDGISCEILQIGAKGWKKGKIKIKVSVEFCPDEPEISEPESPLDEMRKALEKSS